MQSNLNQKQLFMLHVYSIFV